MKLLNVDTLSFSEFHGIDSLPPYVTASHRWLGSEVTFRDIQYKRNSDSEGYKKVESFAKYIQKSIPSVKWLWIDTACINKDSAAELSEAVNLMFEWYRQAKLCIAYLADVETVEDFENSEWFTRGWTLQELLAPRAVIFLTKSWQVVGNKGASGYDFAGLDCGPGLESKIAKITGIPEPVLHSYDSSSSMSIDERMKWMEGRKTTREEDMSYALYGICEVAPGANYGERREGARQRLLTAIRDKQNLAILFDLNAAIFSAVLAGSMPRLKRIVQENPRSAVFAINDRGQTALHLAAQKGSLSMVEFLARNEAVINAEDDDERLPLHDAVTSGNASVVRALIARGADASVRDVRGLTPRDMCNSTSSLMAWIFEHGVNLEARNKEQCTALCMFSRRGDMNAVRTLLDLGANVNAAGQYKHTPLWEACKQDHKELAELLLARGADVHCRNQRNDTVLTNVGWHGHTRIGELLLDHGASIDAVNQHGFSALHECCDHGHVEMAFMLLRRGASIKLYNQFSYAPIHQACRHGHLAIVERLLDVGDDVNHLSPDIHWSPLGEASEHNHPGIIKLLLSRGADTEVRLHAGGEHQTALMRAAQYGHSNVVNLLLGQGRTDINAMDPEGRTALYLAVVRGHTDTTRALLARKPDLESRDKGKYTPLCRAAQACNYDLVHLLLEAGADPNVYESHKWTPLHEAAARGHLEIVKTLLKHGANPDPLQDQNWSPLRLALQSCHVKVAGLLMSTEGVNFNSAAFNDQTPLHEAAYRGLVDMTRELVQRGAIVDKPDHEGITSLHFAAERGHPEVAKFLIDSCKANINAYSPHHGTPLHQASWHKNIEVLKALLERGARKDLRDHRGLTARDLAIERNHYRVLSVIDTYPVKEGEEEWEVVQGA